MSTRDATAKRKNRGPSKVLQQCNELTMLSYNVRGLNTEAKQQKVYEVLRQVKPQLVCLNETKLQSAMFLDHYWSFQTSAQRNGGVWTASLTNAKLSMVKTIGTYLCWTQLEIGAHVIQVLNCYLEPGEQPELKDRAKRVVDIARDITKQDPHAPIIVCGDFNNHMSVVTEALSRCNFVGALRGGTETHR